MVVANFLMILGLILVLGYVFWPFVVFALLALCSIMIGIGESWMWLLKSYWACLGTLTLILILFCAMM